MSLGKALLHKNIEFNSGVASVFTLTAMANINSASWIMLYQPDVPSEEDIG